MKIHKIILGYWLEILIGAFIFFSFDSIGLNFLYLLLIILISSEIRTNYLRALMRTYQIANEAKLMGIANKLNVTKEELEEIGNNVEAQLTKEQMEALEEDFKIVGLKF